MSDQKNDEDIISFIPIINGLLSVIITGVTQFRLNRFCRRRDTAQVESIKLLESP